MLKELLIGIDVGSTNIKCVIYDVNGHIKSITSEPTWSAYETLEIKPQRPFIPEKLWDIAASVCKKAMKNIDGGYVLRGVAVASVGCSAIFLDKKGKSIIFHPTREEIDTAYDECHASKKEYFEETGYPLDKDNSGFFIAACSNKKEFKRVHKILSVADYIAFRLTGEYSREYSLAASMGIYSIKNKDWWSEWLDKFGIEKSILGEPSYGGKLIGLTNEDAAKETKIPKGTRVFSGGHDYPCAAFASNVKKEDILNIFGTVEIMALFTETPRTDLFSDRFRTIIDHHVVPNRYSYMMEAIGAGNTEWFRRNVAHCPKGELYDWDDYLNKVDKIPHSFNKTKELFIPQVYGRMIPDTDRDLTGAFLFLNKNSDNLSMMRAIVEGLAFQSRTIFESIISAQRSIKKLVQIGGGTRQKSWVQTRVNVLGIPIFVPNITESTAMGAALLAGVGSGVYSGNDEAMKVVESLGGCLYEPDNLKFEMYTDIYEQVYLPAIDDLERSEKMLNKIIYDNRRNAR